MARYSTSASREAYIAHPVDSIGGTVVVPGDKSISHRALLLGAIADGETTVTDLLRSEDCLATLGAIRGMGVTVADNGSELRIVGAGPEGLASPGAPLDLGNSGTAMRLMLGLLAAQPFPVTLTGDASLCQRPMERVAEPLRTMGATIETDRGTAPITIRGRRPLQTIDYELPIASGQLKSAILLAGLWADGRTTVRSPGVSRDHTERMLETFGVEVERASDTHISIDGPAILSATEVQVPKDFSSAAFFIVAGLIGADRGLLIPAVGINPSRTGLVQLLRKMGGKIELRDERYCGAEPVADIYVERSELVAADVGRELVDLSIDELPVAFIAAAAARGRTRISGAEELRVKESDRLSVMADGLRSVGIEAIEHPDGLEITGGSIGGGRVDSHGDHRIAMSFAIASAAASAPIEIVNTDKVSTSFPGFPDVAAKCGLKIETLREEADV